MTDVLTREPAPATEPETTPEPGYADQTFLVGENVYLRGFMPGDEKTATSWRPSIFPKALELVETWIKDELPKEGRDDRSYLAIVRKSNDTVVGSIKIFHEVVGKRLSPHVDPLYGEQGEVWLAEAVDLIADWQLGESYLPSVGVVMPAYMETAIRLMKSEGFVETARWREMIEHNGVRYDRLALGRFNPDWIERIGDPMQAELPVTGTGKVQPVSESVVPQGDPPKQAVLIGKRIYLRPTTKEDAKHYVEAWRQEEETFFDIGRHMMSEARWAEFIVKTEGEDHPDSIWFTVCLLENDEVIGEVGLLDVDHVNRVAETGSFFHKTQHRGAGYGSEAKQLLLEYTFNVLGFHMVNSFVYFPNTRSAAALRKQGYTESGRVCWLYPYEGGFGNMVTFDLLAEEWRVLPRES